MLQHLADTAADSPDVSASQWLSFPCWVPTPPLFCYPPRRSVKLDGDLLCLAALPPTMDRQHHPTLFAGSHNCKVTARGYLYLDPHAPIPFILSPPSCLHPPFIQTTRMGCKWTKHVCASQLTLFSAGPYPFPAVSRHSILQLRHYPPSPPQTVHPLPLPKLLPVLLAAHSPSSPRPAGPRLLRGSRPPVGQLGRTR